MISCARNLLFVYSTLSAFLVLTTMPGAGALKFLNAEPFAMVGYVGMNIDINCSTDDPNATVTLLHQPSFTYWVEKPVTPDKLILTGQVFKLLNLIVTDGGRYNCKATDSLNNTIRWSKFKGLLILQPGTLPKYFKLIPEKPIIVLQGQGGQVSCEAEGSTVSKLTWKKQTNSGDVSVPNSMVTNIIDKAENLVKAILTITNAQPGDGGAYKCVLTAFNKQDHKLTAIRVDAPKPPTINDYTGERTIPEGMEKVLKCVATASPKPNVTWYRNGKALNTTHDAIYEVYEDNPSSSLHSSFTTQMLKIRSALYPRDQGEFECIATNGILPNANLVIDLNVQERLKLVPEKPIIVLRGHGGQISCEAKGSTVSKLTWIKLTTSGDVSVPDSMVTNVIDKADNLVKAILSITNARPEDGGDYKCVLTAFNKQNHKQTSVRVVGLAFFKKPQIVLEGYLSQNLVIDCSTNDKNAAVSLLYKYHPLAAFTERKLEANKLSRKRQVFKLLNLDAGDAGIYACEARSHAREIVRWPHGTGYLFLSRARIPHYFVLKPEQPVRILKGHDTNITCESEGIEVTKLQWKKKTSSRYVSVPDNMVTIVKDRFTNRVRAVLKITDAQMQDSGVYKCVLRVFGKKDYKLTRIVIGEI